MLHQLLNRLSLSLPVLLGVIVICFALLQVAPSDPAAVLAALPKDISTPELKIPMQEGQPHALIRSLQQQGRFPTAVQRNTIDGVRAEYADGFGLARASNTTPVIVLRFEADTDAALHRIQEEFRAALLALDAGLDLPF